jgi:hypothetical protein
MYRRSNIRADMDEYPDSVEKTRHEQVTEE